jgi:hypothetical protein
MGKLVRMPKTSVFDVVWKHFDHFRCWRGYKICSRSLGWGCVLMAASWLAIADRGRPIDASDEVVLR